MVADSPIDPISTISPDKLTSIYNHYISWFIISFVLLIIIKLMIRSSKETKPIEITSLFKKFQYNYLLVYLLMMCADWLQGPYVYSLYKYYGYDIQMIGYFFIIGFATSLIIGIFIGSAADRYGRKNICICFGIIYSISCICKHSPNIYVLIFGRITGGISTSILFSIFETWMVSYHYNNNFRDEWLALTFSLATSGNGIVAILAGVMASIVRDNFGPVAPFDLSLVLLIIGTIIIATTWTENYGDQRIDMGSTVVNAFNRLRSDYRIILIGIIQSCFESAMYIFVFMWTPALENSAIEGVVLHGWVFATFMIAVLIGSTIFGYLMSNGYKVERFTAIMFLVASISLAIPAFYSSHDVRFGAFLIFECCCGIYWPALGTIKSHYVPEEVRGTIMNLFRIPLNAIVVIVLIKISSISQSKIFALCSTFLLFGLLCQILFIRLTVDLPEAHRKEEGVADEKIKLSTEMETI